MKALIITIINIALLATMGYAQEPSSNKPLEKRAEAVTLIKEAVESRPILFGTVIKNKPYSAEAVSESVQTLVDGNRITRKTSVKMFRDSEGRTRREGSGNVGNLSRFPTDIFPSAFTLGGSDSISIYDPVDKVRYRLNPKTKTARRSNNQRTFEVATNLISDNSTFPKTLKTKKLSEMSAEERAETEKKFAKLNKDLDKFDKKMERLDKDFSNVIIMGSVATLSYKSTDSESLGTKMIEGIEAEGTRTIRTIEAGAIGNDLPIEITYEKWYSKDLNLVVYSRKYDPRSGEQIYRLTNIDQSEPDISLFTVPSDYKIVDPKPITLRK